MLCAFLDSPGSISLREVKTPSPKKGELLIKIKSALTCGTDLKAFLRGHPVIPMPGPFGHEFSGVVERAGRDAPFKEGTEIMSVHSAPCLRCNYCKKGLYNLCQRIMDTKILGAFSEYILIPAHIAGQNTYKKPKNIGFDEAGFLEPLACVVHGIQGLEMKPNDNALVIGAGPIGLLHLMLLSAKGLNLSICDINDTRLKEAKKLAPAHIFSPKDISDMTKKITHIGYDYIFECTGRIEVWESAINYLRRGGSLILFGGCPPGSIVRYDAGRLHYDEITIKGVFHFTPDDVKEARELIIKKTIDVGRLISGSYPLSEIGSAFERLRAGDGIKYAIKP